MEDLHHKTPYQTTPQAQQVQIHKEANETAQTYNQSCPLAGLGLQTPP